MTHRTRLAGIGGLLAALVAAAPARAVEPPAVSSPGEAAGLESTRQDLASLVNRERRLLGLEALDRHAALEAGAQRAAGAVAAKMASGPAAGESVLSGELSAWLEGAGYEARRAVAHAVVVESENGAEAGEALENLLFGSGRKAVEQGLLAPELRDLGIGFAASGARHVVLFVTALSRQGDFETRTRSLDDTVGVRSELLAASNNARGARGRRELETDSCLERVAQSYAERMLAESFYGHVSPDGLDPRERARAGRCFNSRVAENLAQGTLTPAATVEGWMGSPGHRANLLDRELTRVGFGVAAGRNEQGYRVLWVQLLGSS